MTWMQPEQAFSPDGKKAEAAQDMVYRRLKQHVLGLPRDEGIFLTEAEVCRAIGTSRTPVREALLRLEADGLLQIVPKKGAYVAPITEAQINSLMQARALVEDWCARRAAGIGEPLADELDRLIRQQDEMRDNPVGFIECDREFHRTIVNAAGNPVLAEFYESLRDRQLRMGVHAVLAAQDRVASVLAEHEGIAAGVRAEDAERAAAATSLHLSNTLTVLRLPTAPSWAKGIALPQGSGF